MTALALCLSALYFVAVGVAFLNDRRRARRTISTPAWTTTRSRRWSRISEPVEAGEPVDASHAGRRRPSRLERRYDDMT